MKKFKILLISTLVLAISLFFMQSSFASMDPKSIGNSLENIAEGTSNVVISGSDALINAGETVGYGIKNTMDSSKEKMQNEYSRMEDQMPKSNYNATQTATTRTVQPSGEPTILGMNSTIWTWMIVILTAIGIGALIWFYNSAKSEIRNK